MICYSVVARCVFFCPIVQLLDASIVSKLFNPPSSKQCHVVTKGVFLTLTIFVNFSTKVIPMGMPNTYVVWCLTITLLYHGNSMMCNIVNVETLMQSQISSIKWRHRQWPWATSVCPHCWILFHPFCLRLFNLCVFLIPVYRMYIASQ